MYKLKYVHLTIIYILIISLLSHTPNDNLPQSDIGFSNIDKIREIFLYAKNAHKLFYINTILVFLAAIFESFSISLILGNFITFYLCKWSRLENES